MDHDDLSKELPIVDTAGSKSEGRTGCTLPPEQLTAGIIGLARILATLDRAMKEGNPGLTNRH